MMATDTISMATATVLFLLLIIWILQGGLSDRKLLVIKDSFGDTMMPLLSLGCHNLTVVDIRHFNGSLRTLIKDTRPDAVLVIYTNNWEGSINWNSHGDEFDFR